VKLPQSLHKCSISLTNKTSNVLDKQTTAAPPTNVLETEKALMLVLDFTCSLGVNIPRVDMDTKAEASNTQIASTVKRRLCIIIAAAVVSLVLFLLV
jgi:hypothetical protein